MRDLNEARMLPKNLRPAMIPDEWRHDNPSIRSADARSYVYTLVAGVRGSQRAGPGESMRKIRK